MAEPQLVLDAIRQARYNETVQVTISKENGTTDDIYLVPCLEETNGGIQWLPLDTTASNGSEAADDVALSRHLQTKRWIVPMLNDFRRNELYKQAIQKVLTSLPIDRRSDDLCVLDIGTGTGLLAMFAASQLTERESESDKGTLSSSSKPSVVSVEMSATMAELARRIIRDNGLHQYISVLAGHSSTLTTLATTSSSGNDLGPDQQQERRAHVCISELLESGLLGEGILPTLRHAWKHLLHPNASVLPRRARVYAAIVEGEWISNLYGPHAHEPRKGTVAVRFATDQNASARLLDARPAVLPVHAHHMLQHSSLRQLTKSKCVLTIGFGKDELPEESGQQNAVAVTVDETGRTNGILVWWELDLLDGGDTGDEAVTYSMEPGVEPWQDHWHQCLHVVPFEQQATVEPGQTITLRASHNDSRVFVSIAEDHSDTTTKRRRLDNQSHSTISPLRALALNDTARTKFFVNAIGNALARNEKDDLLLDLSDFSYCACLAALAGFTNIKSVESSSGDLPMTAARVSQIGNDLPLPGAKYEILQCHVEQLNLEVLGAPAQFVVAEPYYEVLEGWELQSALNFYYLVRSLRAKELVSPDTCIVPANCRIMGCIVESEQLRSAYSRCGEGNEALVGDFRHTIVNRTRGGSKSAQLSLPLWQYEYRKLSMEIELARLDFSSMSTETIRTKACATFQMNGTCDALIAWIVYGSLGGDENTAECLSTLGCPYQQSVLMLDDRFEVSGEALSSARVDLSTAIGGLAGMRDHEFDVSFSVDNDGAQD